MSSTQPFPTTPDRVCEECCDATGGCGCETDLTTCSPDPSVSGLSTPYGSFNATYNGQLTDAQSGAESNMDFGMGANWLPSDLAYYTTLANGDLAFIWSATRAYWFTPTGGGNFSPHFGVKVKLSYLNNVYTLTEDDGTSYQFAAPSGLLQKTTTPGGQITENLFDGSGRLSETRRQYPEVSPTSTESRVYTYYGAEGGDNAGQLKYVTLERSSSPRSPRRRLRMRYYASANSGGNLNDLRTVTAQTAEGSRWTDVETQMFRYYVDGEANGYKHGLKFVLSPAAYRRLSRVVDPLTASDTQVAQFADFQYKYTVGRRLYEVILAGGTRAYQLTFTIATNHTIGYNNWQYKTEVTHPDGYVRRFYSNHVHQEILNLKFNPDDTSVYWATFKEYAVSGPARNQAKLTLTIPPAGITSFPLDTEPDPPYNPLTTPPYLEFDRAGADSDLAAFSITVYGTGTVPTAEPPGYVVTEKITDGQGGTESILRTYEYSEDAVTGGFSPMYLRSKVTEIPDPLVSADDIVTTYAYVLHPSGGSNPTPQISKRTTTLPVIPTDQNGKTTPPTYTTIEDYDTQNRLTASTDENSVKTTYQYDDVTGAQIQMTEDATGTPLVTDYTVDDLARTIQTLGPLRSAAHGVDGQPVRQASWTVYKDALNEVWTAAGYTTGTNAGPAYNYTLVNPVSISRTDADGRTTDQITAVRSDTEGPLSPGDSYPQSTWISWSKTIYDDAGRMTSSRVYHTIPATGEGISGDNYDETTYGYDISANQNRATSPGGTISRTVFDPRDQATATWIGTNDTGASDDNPAGPTPPSPAPADAYPNNMVVVSESQYDGNTLTGSGLLTKTTLLVDGDSDNDQVTDFAYDYRDRQITAKAFLATTGSPPRSVITAEWYDNLDRTTYVRQFDTVYTYDATDPTFDELTNLIAKSLTQTDTRGRVYRTERWGMSFTPQPAPADQSFVTFVATVNVNVLADNTWFDGSGNIIKSQPAGSDGFTKTTYDGLNRPTAAYTGYYNGVDPDPWSLANNKIFEQVNTSYDDAGNVTQAATLSRYDNDTSSTGALTAGSKARPQYEATWYDGVGRTIAGGAYGNQGRDFDPFTRPASPPDSSDDVLVSTTTYNSGGQVSTSIDPAGIINFQEYDNAGRGVRSIANYQTGAAAAADDANVTTETTYNPDGKVATLVAKNADTGDQTTSYEYGVIEFDESDPPLLIIATNDLLRATIYPDSVDGDDQVKYTYNRQGQTTTLTDQNGTVRSSDYDLIGQQTQDRVTTVGSGVDNAVLRIATTYEVRGMVLAVTSYDNATVGAGSVLNEVKQTYNDFAQLVTEQQEHVGAVGGSTYKVQYTYAEGVGNTSRPLTVTYPNGRVLTFGYGPFGGQLNQIDTLEFDGGDVASYEYLGLGTIVSEDYGGAEMRLVYTNGAHTYPGFDRFGRIVDQKWIETDGETDIDRFLYGYDRVSNRTYRENTVVTAIDLDELYGYDDLQRLTAANRGELVAAKDRITDHALAQTWQLDPTGNWKGFTNFDQATPANDLVQQRTTNAANEITDLTETVGDQWTTPAHDRSGNMTTMPQPDTPTSAYTCSYDAWNRLATVKDGATTIGQYSYDGLNRRIRKYVPGGTDSYQHLYYNAAWQLLETREAATSPVPSTAQYQYVWSLRYLDAPVLRDDLVPTPDVRLYYTGDANFNVTALFEFIEDLTAVERYVYDPYGNLTIYNDDWTATQAPTVYNNSTLYTGQWRDVETGLMYYRRRYYHVLLGLFITADPLGFVDGLSMYGYVGGNSVTYIDPSGEFGLHDARISLRKSGVAWGLMKDQDVFDEWIRMERARGTGWVDALPACPCNIMCRMRIRANYDQLAPVITNPDKAKWSGPAGLFKAGKYHPGGKWELRSLNAINGHGEQCVYNEAGILIESGFGAGTADLKHATTSRVAAIWGWFHGGAHMLEDVQTYDLAYKLDKGKAWADSTNILAYKSVRPTSDKPCTEPDWEFPIK